jgi:molecular chaperone GrpE
LAEDQPFVPEAPPAAGPGKPEASAPEAAAPVAPIATAEAATLSPEAYQGRARLAEDRLAEVMDAYRKLKAESEAHRDRTTRNLERRFDQRRELLLLKFIDILDNMDRALDAAQTAYADQSMLEGLILVRTQLLQTLQDEGLDRIPVIGLPFDPHVSEAVGTERVDDPEQDGIVLKELMRGYRLNGRVARASRVVMAEYRADEAAPPDEPPVADAEPAAGPQAATAPAPEGPKGDGDLTLEEIIAQTEREAEDKTHAPGSSKR